MWSQSNLNMMIIYEDKYHKFLVMNMFIMKWNTRSPCRRDTYLISFPVIPRKFVLPHYLLSFFNFVFSRNLKHLLLYLYPIDELSPGLVYIFHFIIWPVKPASLHHISLYQARKVSELYICVWVSLLSLSTILDFCFCFYNVVFFTLLLSSLMFKHFIIFFYV